MTNNIYKILLFLSVICLSGCNNIQQELGLKSIPLVMSDKIDLNNTDEKVYDVEFKKNTIYYMRYSIQMLNGAGSNPKSGQDISGKYKLLNNAGEFVLGKDFSNILGSNIVSGTLFEIYLKNINIDKSYKLIIKLDRPSPSLQKYYESNILIYLMQLPSYPVLY